MQKTLIRLEEKLDKAVDFSSSAAQRVSTTEFFNNDAQSLELKWLHMEDVYTALQDVEKRGAIVRLLQSNLVSSNNSSYVGDVISAFFHESLHGRLYLGVASG